MSEDKQEELVNQMTEWLRPHVDDEVVVDWQMDDVPVAVLSFTIEGVKYNLTIAEEY